MGPHTGMRIGIDVGGTNTDAVLMSGTTVLASCKQLSTNDVASGITAAIQGVLSNANIGVDEIQAVMLGTTQFVNALIQRNSLARVLVVRLCGPATLAMPPFIDCPMEALNGGYMLVGGGFEYNGQDIISPVSSKDVQAVADHITQQGIESVVICGVFSPVNASQEQEFATKLKDALIGQAKRTVHITLSSQLGQLGLLERENASILNAALMPLAARCIPHYQQALTQLGMSAVLLLTANDGTLMPAHVAQQLPVACMQSGPVNSLRGASFLTGCQDAVVLDIGGTTTDVGVMVAGLPRPAGHTISICGVRTNFRMPDVMSIGLGGGSYVHYSTTPAPAAAAVTTAGQQVEVCKVGPLSLGNQLLHRSLLCGGDTFTATDVAVLLGKMQLEGVTQQAACKHPPEQQLAAAWQDIQQQLEGLVDMMKSAAGDVPVIVVGGGAALCGQQLTGASAVIRPEHADVANAVGAAIPQVSGSVDAVFQLGAEGQHRGSVIKQAVQRATDAAVASGAIAGACHVVEQDEVPLSYLPGGAARVRVRVVGDLDLNHLQQAARQHTQAVSGTSPQPLPVPAGPGPGSDAAQQPTQQAVTGPVSVAAQKAVTETESGSASSMAPTLAFHVADEQADAAQHWLRDAAALSSYKPHITDKGEWQLCQLDVDALSLGAQVLGTGGGGSAHNGRLRLLKEMAIAAAYSQAESGAAARRGPHVISLASLSDDAMVVDVGGMGAPTVSAEKVDAYEGEVRRCLQSRDRKPHGLIRSIRQAAVRAVAPLLPQPITALVVAEVGGGNCMEPLVVGSRLGLPVSDADLMGRAFPELQMTTAAIAGLPLTPCALSDEKGNAVVMTHAASSTWVERVLRAACAEMGCTAGLSSTPMTGAQAKKVSLPHSLSLAFRLGMAILTARATKQDPVAALLAAYGGGGRELFTGKVVDVQRNTSQGFVRGHVVLQGQLVGQSTLAASAAASGVQMPASEGMDTRTADSTVSSSTARVTVQHSSTSEANEELDKAAEKGNSKQQKLVIEFQNENLIARCSGSVLASVPDLICCLDAVTAAAVATEDLRYGLRLRVVALPAHPMWCTPAGLATVGPAAFGYHGVQYKPVGKYVQVQPVFTS